MAKTTTNIDLKMYDKLLFSHEYPPQYDNQQLKVMVKDWINDIRQQSGKVPIQDLPAGIRRQPGECVIARSLKDVFPTIAVGPYELIQVIGTTGTGPTAKLPEFVQEFVRGFDNGSYPELLISGTDYHYNPNVGKFKEVLPNVKFTDSYIADAVASLGAVGFVSKHEKVPKLVSCT